MQLELILKITSLAAGIFTAVWSYVRFVAQPAILSEVEKRFISKELYDLQTKTILTTLAEIKAELKEIKQKLEK